MLEFKTDTFRLMNIDEDLPRCPMGLGFTATDPEMLRGTEEEPARLPVEEAQGPRLKVFHPGCVSHSQKPKKWKGLKYVIRGQTYYNSGASRGKGKGKGKGKRWHQR